MCLFLIPSLPQKTRVANKLNSRSEEYKKHSTRRQLSLLHLFCIRETGSSGLIFSYLRNYSFGKQSSGSKGWEGIVARALVKEPLPQKSCVNPGKPKSEWPAIRTRTDCLTNFVPESAGVTTEAPILVSSNPYTSVPCSQYGQLRFCILPLQRTQILPAKFQSRFFDMISLTSSF